jgi:glycosyltransferase involved in cell wall biosynthesis
VTFLNNSQAGANDYADWIGIPRQRITVIYNGVDFGGQQRLSADAIRASRAELGIEENAFVVGGMFRFEAEKRPLLWLDVAAEVAKAIPDAKFVLYGQGRLRSSMEAKVKDLGLGKRIQMLGVTSDPLSAMSLMNVFLLTSYGEGLPNVLLEAQWVGTPVVSTKSGGATEAVDVGVSGWIAATHAAPDIAAAIIELYRDQALMARAAERCPAFVRERFGVERMIAETLKVYGVASQH